MSVIASEYVVLDVETNGLSSLRDDLLSISIYQPDTQKLYNRFLPLELDMDVYTTHINGITKKDLKKATPLSQDEVDVLIEEFDLFNRTILTYGSIDEKFIKNYFKRKGLRGYEKLHFFNFKRNIISSRFSGGNITKDNLCRLYGIDNVQELHTGANDCLLEWELFKTMDNKRLLITHDKVFEFNENYIVPASYLATYPNFKYHTQNLPRFKCSSRVVKKFEVVSHKIKKFPTNFNGMTIEHLINTMLNAERIDSSAFLIQNKSKLKYIGKLPSPYDEIYMHFNSDGTVSAVENKDKALAEELNKFILLLKAEIVPLVDYIKKSIFKDKHILSQELVVHRDKNVLAVCDLSNDTAVLEIKTYGVVDFDKMGDQLFYESNGRDCYIMQIEWSVKKMAFVISKIKFEIDNSLPLNALESRVEIFKNRIANKQVDVVEYVDSHSKVTLRCQVCGNTFSKSYNAMLKRSECPHCNHSTTPKTEIKPKPVIISAEEKQLINRSQKYIDKLNVNSVGKVSVLAYNGAKEKLIAHCNECGHEWNIRADHLLARAYCPLCRRTK
ncbi:MAG: exonuclease domain-containing protein [bacterium]|nr:exonuclease domain-containing protein [bacterium]